MTFVRLHWWGCPSIFSSGSRHQAAMADLAHRHGCLVRYAGKHVGHVGIGLDERDPSACARPGVILPLEMASSTAASTFCCAAAAASRLPSPASWRSAARAALSDHLKANALRGGGDRRRLGRVDALGLGGEVGDGCQDQVDIGGVGRGCERSNTLNEQMRRARVVGSARRS
jgi:hypothetical protein